MIPGSGVIPIGSADADQIYRRVRERRVYPDGVTLEGKTVYKAKSSSDKDPRPWTTAVTVEQLDSAGKTLSCDKHYFLGSAPASLLQLKSSYALYSAWNEGKEYQTEALDRDGRTVLRRVKNTYQQREPVAWWAAYAAEGSLDLADEPANDPRLIETAVTLVDTNQVAKQTFGYDQYNNQTDVSQFDYGKGAAGPLLRRTHTDYLMTNPVNGADYTRRPIHLRSLPIQVSVFDGNGIERARTTSEYDNYTPDENHATLLDRPGISGIDKTFSIGDQTRGNVTQTSRWLLPDGVLIPSYRQYDIAGYTVKTLDPLGNATAFDFRDNYGMPDGEARTNTPPSELGTQASYALPTRVTNALGYTTYTQYDYYLSKPVDGEDQNGVVTSGNYSDVLGRLTLTLRAANTGLRNQTRFRYDDSDRIITKTNDLKEPGDEMLRAEASYDGLGRTTETRTYEASNSNITVQTRYDALDRVVQASNPHRSGENVLWTTTEYDALGRVTAVTTPDNARISISYLGNETTVTDQAGTTRRSVNDALGRMVRVIDDPGGLAYQTSYTYDALDNLTAVVQGDQIRTYVYDSLSRLTAVTNPESGQVSFVYDNKGNLLRKTDASGVVTTYAYDAVDRITGKWYSDGTPTVAYTYDATGVPYSKGRLTSVSSTVSAYTYDEYDALGGVKHSTQRTDGHSYPIGYEYNLMGSVTSLTYPSGKVVTNYYDPAGRISGVDGQKTSEAYKSYASSLAYAAHGGLATQRLGNGLWEHTTFDSARLQPIEIGLGTSPTDSSVLRLDYFYGSTNNNGNLLNQIIGVGTTKITQTYSYDSVNRLSMMSEQGGPTQSYAYDQYGNRAVTGGYIIDPALTPRTLSAFEPRTNRLDSATYDAAGRQTRDAAGNVLRYNADGRLVSFNNDSVTYSYDGGGRRVKQVAGRTAILFVYDAFGQVLAEYTDMEPERIQAGGTSYFTLDTLGSTRVVTGSSGMVKVRCDYLPFGEELAAGVGARTFAAGYGSPAMLRQKFTGYERDRETGLDYTNARYYRAATGAFTSPDPLSSCGNTQSSTSLNAYAYALNNPLRFTDPSGMIIKGDEPVIEELGEVIVREKAEVPPPTLTSLLTALFTGPAKSAANVVIGINNLVVQQGLGRDYVQPYEPTDTS